MQQPQKLFDDAENDDTFDSIEEIEEHEESEEEEKFAINNEFFVKFESKPLY